MAKIIKVDSVELRDLQIQGYKKKIETLEAKEELSNEEQNDLTESKKRLAELEAQ